MRKSSSEYSPGSAQPFHGPEVEYRLSSQYRRPALVRFVITAALTVVLAISRLPILYGAAAITGALAVYFGGSYLWRGRFRTRVTSQGIEVHGYFNHFVPWERVRDIEVTGFGPDQMPLDDGSDAPQQARIQLVGRSAANDGTSATGMSRLASISIVRGDGHKVRLHAPLVSGWAADPDFDDKARQLHELCVKYGRGGVSR